MTMCPEDTSSEPRKMVPNFAYSFYGKLPEEAAIAVLWEKQ